MTTSASPDNTVISEKLRSFIDLESNAVTYDIERHAVERFACAIGDPNPLYTNIEFAESSSHGSLIAPPTFFRSLLPGDYPQPYPEPFAHISMVAASIDTTSEFGLAIE